MKYNKYLSLIIFTIFISSCIEAKTKQKVEIDKQSETKAKQESNFIEKKITNNLYVLKSPNYNTNVGVFIGETSVLLIDPMTGSNNHQNLLNTIEQLSDKPIKYVLNTHSHGDHSGANKFFSKLGATIISHENSKYSNAIYDVTFDDTFTLEMGNETIELIHIKAHTIDDALIYFTKNNVVFMGDSYMTNTFPHFYYGGGGSGHVEILDKALTIGNEKTVFVAGHGNLSSHKEELMTYRQNSITWINKIKELYSQEKTIIDIVEDSQIKQLSTVFNDNQKVPIERFKQTIEKSISSELIVGIQISKNTLIKYGGRYKYENSKIDEIILLNEKLYLRNNGYMYELVPLSKTKFHIKGQAPHRQVIFNLDKNELIYFDGKENRTAKKQ